MRTADIAKRYLDYFAKHDHLIVPSASLISPNPTTQREVIENDSLLSVHCQSIEKSRICTVHRPAYGTDTPVHLYFLQMAGST